MDTKKKTMRKPEAAQRQREQAKEHARKRTAIGQTLPELPKPFSLQRRELCRLDLLLFIRTYCSASCPWEFGKPHLEMIERLQESILNGGLYAIAMQRGGGKTTIAICAALWALSYGHVPFIVLIGATQQIAREQLMEGLKSMLLTNELLNDDFPEITLGIRALEGEGRRCNGQRTAEGEPTRIQWGADRIVTPRMGGFKTDEIVVSCHGITGAFLGLRYVRGNGDIIRPAFAVIDDPQTPESAVSPDQTMKRLKVINTTILGLAGPGVNMAGCIGCTKMNQNCLSSQILDRDKSPKWRGSRWKMVDPMPDDMGLWARYADMRAERYRVDGLREVEDGFLRDNYKDMHAGAEVSWPERINPGDLSPLQTAMNYWADNPEMFASEMQNEPLNDAVESGAIVPAVVMQQIAGYNRGSAPADADACVAAVDCHGDLLYWSVVWYNRESFTAGLVDYGTWPDQSLRNFTRGRVPTTTEREAAKRGIGGEEGILRYALMQLLPYLDTRIIQRMDGATLPIEKIVVDAGWKRDTVYEAIGSSVGDKAIGLFGRGIRATGRPLIDLSQKRKRGVQRGNQWMAKRVRGEPMHIVFDAYFWMSFLSSRIRTPIGVDGNFSIYQESQSHHRLLIDHLTSMYPKTASTEERTIEEWDLFPTVTENHWLDTIVYNLVAASYGGAHLSGQQQAVQQKSRRTYNPGG